MIFYDDFLSLDNWDTQGWSWNDGMVLSQSDFLYGHSLDNELISSLDVSAGDYIMNVNLKYEIEWDYDSLQFGVSVSNSNIPFYELTGHDYELNNHFVPFSIDSDGYLYFNFSSDSSLNYRGVGIDYLGVYKNAFLYLLRL